MNPDRAARLHGAVDGDRAEPFTLRAKKKPASGVNGRRVADETRPDQTIVGVFTNPPKHLFPDARRVAANNIQMRSTSKPAVRVQVALLSWTPQPGDKVEREADHVISDIGDVSPDGFGRWILYLTGQNA